MAVTPWGADLGQVEAALQQLAKAHIAQEMA